jgi:hypothetical protein
MQGDEMKKLIKVKASDLKPDMLVMRNLLSRMVRIEAVDHFGIWGRVKVRGHYESLAGNHFGEFRANEGGAEIFYEVQP